MQYLVQSVLGSGGEGILREGENLILKILVSQNLTQKQNEKLLAKQYIYIYLTTVFQIKNLKQSILRGFANKNLPKMFYKRNRISQ